MMRQALLALAVCLGMAGRAYSGPVGPSGCPSCIQNSAAPQNAQMNIGTATVRGTLDASTMTATYASFTNLVIGALSGNGSSLTNLNASALTSGIVAAARMVGSYTGITGVGTLTAGLWHGTPIETPYGGTGQNWGSVAQGNVPYFSGTGAMAALPPSTPQSVLQTGGAGANPTWTSSPTIAGVNFRDIPLTALTPGTLPGTIGVTDASLSTVAAVKVQGNISGGASFLTVPLPVGNLAGGTLPTSNAASSITANGVTPGIYGGPTTLAQVNVHSDGRVYAVSQSSISLPLSALQGGVLSGIITVPAASINSGALGSGVVASSLTETGVTAGLYGAANRTLTTTMRADGRASTMTAVLISLPLTQLTSGSIPAGITLPAASVEAGSLGPAVIASSVAASGVSPGTCGDATNICQVVVGIDGRVSARNNFPVAGASTATAYANRDNNWSHAQTSQSSWTVNSSLFASSLSGDGFNVTNLNIAAITGLQPIISAIGTSTAALQAQKVNRSGDTMTGALNLSNAPIVLTGTAGYVTSASTVTAAYFVGNGGGITGLVATSCTAGGGSNSVLCQGNGNAANFSYTTVGGGQNNISGASYATVSGGANNQANAGNTFVGGGVINTANAGGALVVGGDNNTANGASSSIGGGSGSTADGIYNHIGGGQTNYTNGLNSTVGGGATNNAVGNFATIAGGDNNTANSGSSTVGGGFGNQAGAPSATVAGGDTNSATGTHSSVGGGNVVNASGRFATASGGSYNTASGNNSAISGGELNTASGVASNIAGGSGNTVDKDSGTISGGAFNEVHHRFGVVGGGYQNVINVGAPSIGGTIGGGQQNTIAGAANDYSTIGGGYDNQVNGYGANICGGGFNYIDAAATNGAIGGGYSNRVWKQAGTVSGGDTNNAYGYFSMIPGGQQNSAYGQYSYAGGRRAIASADGSYAISDSQNADFVAIATDSYNARFQGGYNVTAPTATFSGAVVASKFYGDGSGITNLPSQASTVAVNASMTGDGSSGSPLGVKSSSVAVLNASGFVPNAELDPSSITKQGFVSLANLSGAVPSGRVDFSTITTALGTKASSGTNNDVTALNALTAINSAFTGTTITATTFLGVSGATETTTAALTGVGTAANPLGVNSSSVAVLNASGFVPNAELDPSSVTKQGLVTLANLSGAVPSGRVDFSTITTQFNSVALATTTIYAALNSTASYATTQFNAVALATTTNYAALNSTASYMTTQFNAVAVATTSNLAAINSTASYATSQFNAVAVATTSNSTNITALSLSTASLAAKFITNSSSETNTSAGGLLASSSVTANAFFGDASHLTGYVITGSSYVAGGQNINSLTFVGVATVTVTLRGSRPLTVRASSYINNASAGGRTYNCQIQQNGALVNDPRQVSLTSGSLGIMYLEYNTTSSPSGSNTFSMNCDSSSATGTQTSVTTNIVATEL